MNFGKINEDDLKKLLGKEEDKKVIIKTVPAKQEWVDEHMRLHKAAHDMMDITRKMESDRNKLWAVIALDLTEFRNEMKFNSTTNEIEIYGDPDEGKCIHDDLETKKAVKSPFQTL